MELWNRILISLISLLVLAGAIVTLLVATDAVAPDFLPGGGSGELVGDSWFEPQLRDLSDFSGSGLVVTIVVTILVALSMLGLLLVEMRPIVRSRRSLRISSTPDGALSIEAASVRLLAEKTGMSNRNVSSLKCLLRVRRRAIAGGSASIAIVCYPRVILGSNVPEIREDLQTRIKQSVEQLTGLTVLQVHVVSRYERGDSARLMGV
jgi:hypothetical protein